jgi:hypothetical protein
MQNSSDIAAPIAAANATPRLSLAALRRTSPISHGVTRAMRLSETEHMSRGNTPRRITMEDLTARPRSNPRSRTPMRYESPLTAEFRRESLELDNPATTEAPRRITIRPLVGNTAGTTISTRVSCIYDNMLFYFYIAPKERYLMISYSLPLLFLQRFMRIALSPLSPVNRAHRIAKFDAGTMIILEVWLLRFRRPRERLPVC